MQTSRPLVAFTLSALGCALSAQTPACFAANDTNTNVSNAIYSSSPASPGVWGWKVTPSSPIVAQSLQVFTRNTYGSSLGYYMSLEIWSEDPLNPALPSTRLAGGTWRFTSIPSVGFAWQGTNLDSPVVMQPATNYWIVFIEPGWSTPPIEPGSATTFPMARQLGGVWQPGNPSALKFRVFCGLLDSANVVPFGNACTSTANLLGTEFTNEAPTVGNSEFRLEGTGFTPATPVLNVLGTIPSYPSIPIAGTANCFLSTDWLLAVADLTGTGSVRSGCPTCATAAASGHVRFLVPVPANPSLVNFYFSSQLVALDLGSTQPLPFVSSNALQVTVF